MKSLIQPFKDAIVAKGYKWYDSFRPYNLNIIAVRSAHGRPDYFDDYLFLLFRDENYFWNIKQYHITTEPGISILKNPPNYSGAAILVPGQYPSYRIDLHNGKYPALCQRLGPVKVYRDNNKDPYYDYDPSTIQEGWFGINVHKAGVDSIVVDDWSAGCLVFKRQDEYGDFMRTLRRSEKSLGNKFTLTLLDEKDLL